MPHSFCFLLKHAMQSGPASVACWYEPICRTPQPTQLLFMNASGSFPASSPTASPASAGGVLPLMGYSRVLSLVAPSSDLRALGDLLAVACGHARWIRWASRNWFRAASNESLACGHSRVAVSTRATVATLPPQWAPRSVQWLRRRASSSAHSEWAAVLEATKSRRPCTSASSRLWLAR